MTQAESKSCFLGMIDASVRFGLLNNGMPKTYLTTNYNFGRIWDSLRAHYQQYGLAPKIHKLSKHVSNFAILFTTVLHMLKFIKNYANQHGRSLRDNTREIIYLPACESKHSLFRLYENIEDSEDYKISLSNMRFGAKYWHKDEVEQKIQEWNDHYNWAQLESCIIKSKSALKSLTSFSHPGKPNSLDIETHVS
ncbi:6250_t:CDS:2 [Cetraspora pellucida]|uniref:6250_t:CDS:1 n=1 Tax=Cetraspora pellucida TaxID=1433469 RepID=A0A9N9CWB5_9GLOM|nr:6250_t:CDS:2 [Cetraspora pellucida]